MKRLMVGVVIGYTSVHATIYVVRVLRRVDREVGRSEGLWWHVEWLPKTAP